MTKYNKHTMFYLYNIRMGRCAHPNSHSLFHLTILYAYFYVGCTAFAAYEQEHHNTQDNLLLMF